jgi:hypothetical protein
MRCDWMEILQHGLPELERGQAQARTPKLVQAPVTSRGSLLIEVHAAHSSGRNCAQSTVARLPRTLSLAGSATYDFEFWPWAASEGGMLPSLGQRLSSAGEEWCSAMGQRLTIHARPSHVRFTPLSGRNLHADWG